MAEYRANTDMVKDYAMRLYEAMMEKNPQNCSLAYFSSTSYCVDVHYNISESFNNAIDPSRYMPMVKMLETIRRRTMIRTDLRRRVALHNPSRFYPTIVAHIEMEQKRIKFCKMYPGSDSRCEVLESRKLFSLNLTQRTCACRRYDMSGLPCRHALRAIADLRLNIEDNTSHWYLTLRQQQIYGDFIRPVNGMLFGNKSGYVVLPPPSLVKKIDNMIDRKPKPKRRKSRCESPTKKKASREKKVMHCGRCGIAGHNAKSVLILELIGATKRRGGRAIEKHVYLRQITLLKMATTQCH